MRPTPGWGTGEILVGPDTYRLTAPLFDFDTLAPIQVKGKTDAVQVYRLLGVKAVRGRVRGIEGLTSPLVGREAELGALQAAAERLHTGTGGIVTVVGEAGLGRNPSRLPRAKRSWTICCTYRTWPQSYTFWNTQRATPCT